MEKYWHNIGQRYNNKGNNTLSVYTLYTIYRPAVPDVLTILEYTLLVKNI